MNKRKTTLLCLLICMIALVFVFSGCQLVSDIYNTLKNVCIIVDLQAYSGDIQPNREYMHYEEAYKEHTYSTDYKILSDVFDELRENKIVDIQLDNMGNIVSVDGITAPEGMYYEIFTNDPLNQERSKMYLLYDLPLYVAFYTPLQSVVRDGGYYVIQLIEKQ